VVCEFIYDSCAVQLIDRIVEKDNALINLNIKLYEIELVESQMKI